MLKYLLCFLLMTSPIFAEDGPLAKQVFSDFGVDGPTEVGVGEFVRLDAFDFNSPPYSWSFINPPNKDCWAVGRDGSELFFSVTQPGTYYIILSFVDPESEVKSPILVLHSVNVKGALPNPGPTPNPNPGPGPIVPDPEIPDGEFGFVKLSYEAALKTKGMPKAKELSEVYKAVASQIAAGTLSTEESIATITKIKLLASLGTDFNAWRDWSIPIGQRVNDLQKDKPLDVKAFAGIYNEIAQGLDLAIEKSKGVK